MSRRTLLGAGAATAIVAAGGTGTVLAVRDIQRRHHPPEPSASLVPAIPAGTVAQHTFVSRHMLGRRVGWAVIRPPGVAPGTPLPLVVALHGSGGSAAKLIGHEFGLPWFLADVVRRGVPPFAVAVVSGGYSWWHLRPWGEDPGAMVIEELLPRLAKHGYPQATEGRIGLLGWSMGGYGVLRLGGLLGVGRVSVVCASSPGLYLDPRTAHPLGFVDAAEYREYSVMHRQRTLRGIPVRLAIGTDDIFYPAVRRYAAGFPASADLTTYFGQGAHTLSFTQRVMPDDLAFIGTRLDPVGVRSPG